MALKSGLFNSVDGDRRYNASDFAAYFAAFIANGVFPNPSTGLQVMSNSGMNVVLKPGRAWINGYFLTNDSDYTISLDVADGVLKRIDRIVLRLNNLDREIVPAVKKGTFASSPVAPSLQRDSDIYEIAVADIFVTNGAISISQPNITDQRFNTSLCGIVHGLIDQIDTTTIFAQYQAGFDEWFADVQNTLDGDTAGNLYNLIDALEDTVATHTTQLTTKFDTSNHNATGDPHTQYILKTSAVPIQDTRNVNGAPNTYTALSVTRELKITSVIGLQLLAPNQGFLILETTRPWTDDSGGKVIQRAINPIINEQYVRFGSVASNTWGEWEKIRVAYDIVDYTRTIPWPSGVTYTMSNVVIGNYIYFMTGFSGSSWSYRYDVVANTFTAMAAVPNTSDQQMDLLTDGTDIYKWGKSFGGTGQTISVHKYTVATNTWALLGSTNLPEYETLNSSPRGLCYGGHVYKLVSISDGGSGYVYVIKVDKVTGTVTRLDMSDADSYIYESSYVEGTVWKMGATYWGNSNKYRHDIDLVAFTHTNYNLGTGGSVYGAKVTANGNYYGISGQDISLINATGSALVANKVITARQANNLTFLIPSLGRVLGSNGTYQDIPELINY